MTKLPRALLASTAAIFLFASGSLTTALLFRNGPASHYRRSTQTIRDASGDKTIINYTLTDEPSAAKRKGSANASPASASTSASATSAAAAQMASCPASANGHGYMVVWAGKMNAADLTGKDALIYANGGNVNPEGIKEVLPQELVPGQTEHLDRRAPLADPARCRDGDCRGHARREHRRLGGRHGGGGAARASSRQSGSPTGQPALP